MVYEYSFAVWPDETNERLRRCQALFDLFRAMLSRVGMEFTESGFNDFREEIGKAGFTLREIERVPHVEPESVC